VFESSIEFGLQPFMDRLQWWENGKHSCKFLFVRRLLLEFQLSFLIMPDSPVDKARSGPAMFNLKQPIPCLKQVFDAWYE
jgi:hypothetical protein